MQGYNGHAALQPLNGQVTEWEDVNGSIISGKREAVVSYGSLYPL